LLVTAPRFSRTVTVIPARRNDNASVRPTGPAPTTITPFSAFRFIIIPF
jgi:hypothetical protein